MVGGGWWVVGGGWWVVGGGWWVVGGGGVWWLVGGVWVVGVAGGGWRLSALVLELIAFISVQTTRIAINGHLELSALHNLT